MLDVVGADGKEDGDEDEDEDEDDEDLGEDECVALGARHGRCGIFNPPATNAWPVDISSRRSLLMWWKQM